MKKEKIKKYSGLTLRQKSGLWGYFFFSPWIIGFLVFTLYPIIYSVQLSFNEVTIRPDGIVMKFQGLTYLKTALREDTEFPLILGESIMFIVCSAPIIVIFSLIIALLLNNEFKGRTIYRAIFFLPVIIMSGPVVAELLQGDAAMVLQPSSNPIYMFLLTLPPKIAEPILYILDNLVQIMWFSGVQTIIFIAGLKKVDASVYEAAEVDGASAWEKFWKITLPYLRPMILVNTIYTIVEVSNFSNLPINQKIISHMFETNRPFSYSSAMSLIYFFIVLILVGVGFLVTNNWSERR